MRALGFESEEHIIYCRDCRQPLKPGELAVHAKTEWEKIEKATGLRRLLFEIRSWTVGLPTHTEAGPRGYSVDF